MAKHRVKVGYLETNYVERVVLVEAPTKREAERLARRFDELFDPRIELGEEDLCERQAAWRHRVVRD